VRTDINPLPEQELPGELGEHRGHLRTPMNMRLHREPHHVSDPDVVRGVLGSLDSADHAQLTAPAPDLAVHYRHCLTHATIIPLPATPEHHDDPLASKSAQQCSGLG